MIVDVEAAWVPYRQGRDLLAAAAIAIDWTEEQASVRGRDAVLVTDTKAGYSDEPLLASFADGRHASLRSRRVAVQVGAVVAYLPTPEVLDLATGLARGKALAVVEHPSWRLAGWAAAIGAVDLDTSQTTPLSPALGGFIDRLVMVGHNGYGPIRDRNDARRALTEMAAANLLDRDLVLGALAAHRISPAALKVIDSML